MDRLLDRIYAQASHGVLKRDPRKAAGKSEHNRARFLVNLVIEAAGPTLENYSTEDILKTALFLAKGSKA